MKRLTPVLAALLLVGCATVPTRENNRAFLTILHWNDFHARNIPYDVSIADSLTGEKHTYQVGGSGNLAGYMDFHGRSRDGVLLLNAGDDFQGTPVSTLTNGSSQIELMNLISPDAMALGNHEFDYGLENLRNNIAGATFPILAANLFDSLTGSTFAAAAVVKHTGRVKAGIIGLLPPDLPILTMKQTLAGTRMLAIDSVLSFHIDSLRKKEGVDIVIVLSHMGFENDTTLAMRRNDIDIIVGGHTHLPLFTPVRKGRTVVVQAGSHGRYLGKLDVTVDLAGDSLLDHSGRLIETRTGVHPVAPLIDAKARELEATVDVSLGEVIGTLTVDWRRSFRTESNIGNWMTDALRKFAGTDIAFMNSGTLRKNLNAGPITKRDIIEIVPFNNSIVTFSVRGDTLLKMLEWQAAGKGEFMQVSGLGYTFDGGKPFGEKLVSATVNNQPVDPKRLYSVATNSYVGGHLDSFFGLPESTVEVHELNAVDHLVLIEAIRKQRTIASSVEGRVVNINPGP